MTTYFKDKESDDDEHSLSSSCNISNEMINVNIRTVNYKEVKFSIYKSMLIKDLKHMICKELLLDIKEYNVRLIFNGKLINYNDKPLAFYNIKNNSFLHCMINKVSSSGSSNSSSQYDSSTTINADNNTTMITTSNRGFNSLLSVDNSRTPFTIEDVNAIRSYFTTDVNDFM